MTVPSPKSTTVFDLPANRSAKADPRLVAADERHLIAVADTFESHLDELTERLATLRRSLAGKGRRHSIATSRSTTSPIGCAA